ncbi:HNH endonuclease [Nocardioides sp. Root140]|uniref:HNH endonuclease n=1 Tax=Nocardioides sp. Root140 TaxID=1736460 RepID=UPI0006FE0976|nr:HNH endonuclease signature motif containing protein [Nocardioides sp. Root140]KQY64725.1 hypothetical protein ASD30_07475 [Nocardioides sp. Root140]
MFDHLGILGSLGDDARRLMPPEKAMLGLVEALPEMLAELDVSGLKSDELVATLGNLEVTTSSAAALKAKLSAELFNQRADTDQEAGVPPAQCGKAVGHEVGLARHESPSKARGLLAMARVLTTDMPETLKALERGDINERRAKIIVDETEDLSSEDRQRVDAALAPKLAGKGDKELRHKVRQMVCKLDAEGAEKRARKARAERRVTGRDLGNGMMRICGDIPAEDGAAAMQSLGDYADTWKAAGDERTRDQMKADAFVERLVGSPWGKDSLDDKKPRSIEIQLVMSAEMLLGGDSTTPAHIPGYGPLPLGIAHELIANADGEVFIRRLYAHPDDNGLVAMDSKGIKFPVALRRLIYARDGAICRQPYCDAPIRHDDHVMGKARGGKTCAHNGQGLCEACNYAKEAPRWRYRTRSQWPERHTIEITTPTGQTYDAVAPPLPMPPTRSGTWRARFRNQYILIR